MPGGTLHGRRLGVLLAAVALADAATAIAAALRGPFPERVEMGSPTAYRCLYLHVPVAWVSYMLFALGFLSALMYMKSRRLAFDRMALASILVGELYGVATLLSGMSWAHESWGAAWNWDPRETAVLLLVLAYLGYFAVRSTVADPERARLASSSYAVAAFSLVVLSFLSTVIAISLHPNPQQASPFLGSRKVLPFLLSRMAAATLSAALALTALGHGQGSRILGYAGVAVMLLGLAASLYLSHPYLQGNVRSVSGAVMVDNGLVTAVNFSDGASITFAQPLEPPIQPAIAPDGTPTLVGHEVIVDRNSLRVVVHWSVALSLALYTALVGALLIAIGRGVSLGSLDS